MKYKLLGQGMEYKDDRGKLEAWYIGLSAGDKAQLSLEMADVIGKSMEVFQLFGDVLEGSLEPVEKWMDDHHDFVTEVARACPGPAAGQGSD